MERCNIVCAPLGSTSYYVPMWSNYTGLAMVEFPPEIFPEDSIKEIKDHGSEHRGCIFPRKICSAWK